MPVFKKAHATQGLNAALRLSSMIVKMGLTLYMGKFFALADIGLYGLVVGAVSILTVFFGQNFAYIVNRDIVGAPDIVTCHKIRDECLFYIGNYVVFFVLAVLFLLLPDTGVQPRIVVYVFILTILEGLGAVTYFNLNSLNKQLRSNALFFIRSGFWALPVVGLCVFYPHLRCADTVLIAWIVGSATSLAVTAYMWRHLPWMEAFRKPVDWIWIRKGTATILLVWVGMLGVTCGSYLDRFVVEHYLSIEDVGVLTFYFSFTSALLTLMQSGVAAFATPRLVQHHRDNAHDDFNKASRHAVRQINIGAGIIALGLAVAVPTLGYILGRPAFVSNSGIFLLMLFATWVRADAEMKSNILFARHQDRAIWLGNILFLIPAFGGNLLLVPLLGFSGIGFSAVGAALFLLGWRWWHVKNFVPQSLKSA